MRSLRVPAAALAMLLINLGPSFSSTSWREAIASVAETQETYYDFAAQRGARPGAIHVGNGYERHQCAIIGRMLGRIDDIEEAETFDNPVIHSQADPHEMMLHAVFLDSWIVAAENALQLTQSQKVSIWNLECIGEHGISASAFIEPSEGGSDFSIINGGLFIHGDIEAGFYERLIQYLESAPSLEFVALGSGGGGVRDAMLAGLLIRELGYETTLWGPCLSACTLLFAGGQDRVLNSLETEIGFHQITVDGLALPDDSEIYEVVIEYFDAMGVEGATAVAWMKSTPPNEMYFPDPQAICDAGFAHWIQRVCQSE